MTHPAPYRRTCFKLAAADEWYPPYRLNGYHRGVKDPLLVEVSFICLPASGEWRVCVWGADDFGMERDYPPTNMLQAETMFNILLEQQSISVSFLKAQGFWNA
jgi:hypothetical protein